VKVSATVRGGRLTVKLKHAVKSVSVRLAAPLLIAKKHLRGHPKLHITVTDASGNATALSLSTG
jgi:hypothetical protein